MKKILMILAEKNFRDIEYIVPRAFFEQHNFLVTTASTKKESVGKFGFAVTHNHAIDALNSADFDAVILVGGLGSLDFMNNKIVQNLVEQFVTENKICAAICAAPRNFLAWGLLKNHTATGNNFDGNFPELCRQSGAIYSADPVVVSKNFITADGPESAENFTLEIIKSLS